MRGSGGHGLNFPKLEPGDESMEEEGLDGERLKTDQSRFSDYSRFLLYFNLGTFIIVVMQKAATYRA